jgi:hypothetical protein
MRICISEYIFQTPLSYYYIDTKDIPNKYEYAPSKPFINGFIQQICIMTLT